MRPRIAIVSAYFDWFSGYQEVALARALSEIADVTVFTSDIVNPIFSKAHRERVGTDGRYTELDEDVDGITVSRFRGWEIRSMVLAVGLRRAVRGAGFDLVIQVMPGFLLPAVASTVALDCPRVVLYGDNSAMYARLPPLLARVKFGVFAVTKGLLYRYVNRRAAAVYGYTPETIDRLEGFAAGRETRVMPLVYDPEVFYVDPEERAEMRAALGLSETDALVIGVGKINRQKRFDLLVKAFEDLARTDPTIHLAILGLSRETASEDLRTLVEASRFRDRITLLDFADSHQLRRLFNAADVGVWPRMPAVTIQQAMGTGLPVVLPHNAIVSHLISNDQVGRYFSEDGDHYLDMASKIESLLATRGGTRDESVTQSSWLSAREVASTLISTHT